MNDRQLKLYHLNQIRNWTLSFSSCIIKLELLTTTSLCFELSQYQNLSVIVA